MLPVGFYPHPFLLPFRLIWFLIGSCITSNETRYKLQNLSFQTIFPCLKVYEFRDLPLLINYVKIDDIILEIATRLFNVFFGFFPHRNYFGKRVLKIQMVNK